VLPTTRVWFREDPNQGVEALLRDRGEDLMQKSRVRHMKGANITSDKGGMIPWAKELTRAVKAPNYQRQPYADIHGRY